MLQHRRHPPTLRILCWFLAHAQVSGFTDVSVLFVGISGVDLGLHSSDADMLWGQIIMSTVQECVYDHEGAVSWWCCSS